MRMGQPGKIIRQATKHGTVLKLGFTQLSAFETGQHGGGADGSSMVKRPRAKRCTSPVSRPNPGSLHRRPLSECPHRAAGVWETLRVANRDACSKLCQDSGEARAASP